MAASLVRIPEWAMEGVKRRFQGGVSREQGVNDRIRVTDSGCWDWTGEILPQGYGRLRWKGRKEQAHRLIYTWMIGPIPDGLELDHRCRVRSCVNPAHLDPVTHRENPRRGAVGFEGVRKHCKNGLHDITDPANVYEGGGRKTCYPCRKKSLREAARAKRLREKEEA